MSNLLAQNPMNIDTPGAAILVATKYKLKHIEFTGYASATDKVIVTNAAGYIIAELSGTTDKQEVRTSTIGWVDGIAVPTLTSGICLIYFE